MDDDLRYCTFKLHNLYLGVEVTRVQEVIRFQETDSGVQGLLDVLQGNYGGDPAKMPYVVNKEAFS